MLITMDAPSKQLTYCELADSANVSSAVTRYGERVRELRRDRRMTQEQLATASGLRRAHIAMIETGSIANPEVQTLASLATGLGITLQELMQMDMTEPSGQPAGAHRDDVVASDGPLRVAGGFEIVDANPRMIGKPVEAYVAAGHGGWDDATDREIVMLPEFLFGPNDFVVKAVGDSMIDEAISPGDYLIVERRPNGIATHGDLIIGWLNDGLVVKRWYRRGGKKFLESANAEMGWEPREITPDDVFEIQAVVKHIVKRPNTGSRPERRAQPAPRSLRDIAPENHPSPSLDPNAPVAPSVHSSASPSIPKSDRAAIPAGLTRLVDGFDDEEITDATREREAPGSHKGRKPT